MKAMTVVMGIDLIITCIVIGGAGIVQRIWPLVVLALLMFFGFGSMIVWMWKND